MAIRFQCAACAEPIEVDDQWARQLVRCPYCQRTVTAPAESTLGEIEQIPLASAPRGEDIGSPLHPAGIPTGFPPESGAMRNSAATVSLVLAFVTVFLFGLAAVVLGPHSLEMQEMVDHIEKARREGSGFTQAMMDYMNEHGGKLPGWMIASSLLSTAAMLACVATIIMGALGLRHPRRRAWAGASLAVSGLIFVMYCGGALFR